MTTYDSSSASCHVLTFKEGLLSRVAHDLKFQVQTLSIAVDEGQIEATFDADSLKCLCAMKRGRENPKGLSRGDIDKIEQNMRREVLEPSRFPQVRFVSTAVERTGSQLRIRGTLELHGQTKPIQTTASLVNGHWEAELVLHQPTWAIKPFTAVMGTMKVKPDVRVRVRVPA